MTAKKNVLFVVKTSFINTVEEGVNVQTVERLFVSSMGNM